jgi:2-polyprenyl-3-methyl-5-hydroxy-6-metoxy-1,4-benzoquinol methylase
MIRELVYATAKDREKLPCIPLLLASLRSLLRFMFGGMMLLGFFNELDPDVAATFTELKIAKGAVCLDLGCGPGTQARELCKAGYVVVGSDVSPTGMYLVSHSIEEWSSLECFCLFHLSY